MTVFPIKDSDKFPPNEKYIFALLKLILKRDIMIHIGTPNVKKSFGRKGLPPHELAMQLLKKKADTKRKILKISTQSMH